MALDGTMDRLRLLNTEINTSSELSVQDFYQSAWMKPDMLTDTITHLFGNQFKNELMLQEMTIGRALVGDMSAKQSKEVKTNEYEFMLMGRFNKNEQISVSDYTSTSKAGQYGQPFFLQFASDLFKRGYVIESPNEHQVRINKDGEPFGQGYRYECTYLGDRTNSFIPWTETVAGTQWASFFAPVSQAESKNPGSGKRVLPGKGMNQMNTLRATMEWRGNVANKALCISVPVNATENSPMWMQQDRFMLEIDWVKAKETVMMYGKFNRDNNGQVLLTESDRTAVVTIGAGLLEQIPNTFQYTTLSHEVLKSMMMDIFYTNPLTMGKEVIMFTGQGGIEEFDRAMKDYMNSTSLAWNTTNDKIVGGAGSSLAVEAHYFDRVVFIGGYKLTVKHNKMFDMGARAVKSPRHPRTGYPMESYRMIFLDPVSLDGKSNIIYVHEKGREVFDKQLQGMAVVPDYMGGGSNIASTDEDIAKFMRIGTCGIHLLNPTTSLHGICIAS